jgi:hypothetical protein
MFVLSLSKFSSINQLNQKVMRQITAKICFAFEQGRTLKIDNSETDGTNLWLFGNKIAEWRQGEIWITDAGWQSKTTKERLNGLGGVNVTQRAGSWYLNGNLWQGEWTSVNENNGIVATPQEVVQFDITSEWKGSYSKPIYSVFHTTNKEQLNSVYRILNEEDIEFRMIESDTEGEYKPNYFVVVEPHKVEIATNLIKSK